MSDAPLNRIDARMGFLARRVSCRLTDHHVEILNGAQQTRIGYGDLSSIRVFRQRARGVVLDLTSANGKHLHLRLTPSSGPDEKVMGFTRSLIERVAEVAPGTRLLLGPGRRQWLAAWIGLIASVAILVGAVWVILSDAPVGPVLLPVGIAFANLAVVVPVLQAGRPRVSVVAATPASLV